MHRSLAWLVLFSLVIALALRMDSLLRPREIETLTREQLIYRQLRGLIRERYVDNVDERNLFYGAMEGMAASLDPHTDFLRPEKYEQMKVMTSGNFVGVGIEINADKTVLTPLDGSPAYKAGVLPGDKIVKIDDTPTEPLTLDECSKLIKGLPGTTVRLTLLHEGETQTVEVTLTRAVIEMKSVTVVEMLNGVYVPTAGPRIGLVQINQFQERTAADLDAALRKLEGQGLQGLIIDLRQNGGGLLESAVDVADLFLKDGVIVTVVSRTPSAGRAQNEITYAQGPDRHPDYPIVILVDSRSASASEIVAGALKDRMRAVLVGEKTYGKGSVQSVIDVPLNEWGNAALKITVAKYQTPSGAFIDGKGITPDHLVPLNNDQMKIMLQERLRRHVRANDPRGDRAPIPRLTGDPTDKNAPPFIDLQLKKAAEVLTQQLEAKAKQ